MLYRKPHDPIGSPRARRFGDLVDSGPVSHAGLQPAFLAGRYDGGAGRAFPGELGLAALKGKET